MTNVAPVEGNIISSHPSLEAAEAAQAARYSRADYERFAEMRDAGRSEEDIRHEMMNAADGHKSTQQYLDEWEARYRDTAARRKVPVADLSRRRESPRAPARGRCAAVRLHCSAAHLHPVAGA